MLVLCSQAWIWRVRGRDGRAKPQVLRRTCSKTTEMGNTVLHAYATSEIEMASRIMRRRECRRPAPGPVASAKRLARLSRIVCGARLFWAQLSKAASDRTRCGSEGGSPSSLDHPFIFLHPPNSEDCLSSSSPRPSIALHPASASTLGAFSGHPLSFTASFLELSPLGRYSFWLIFVRHTTLWKDSKLSRLHHSSSVRTPDCHWNVRMNSGLTLLYRSWNAVHLKVRGRNEHISGSSSSNNCTALSSSDR